MKNVKIFLTQFKALMWNSNICLIKNKTTNGDNFKFKPVSLSDFELKVRFLNLKKATIHKNIPPKILKSSSEATVNVLHKLFNETITKGVFLDNYI